MTGCAVAPGGQKGPASNNSHMTLMAIFVRGMNLAPAILTPQTGGLLQFPCPIHSKTIHSQSWQTPVSVFRRATTGWSRARLEWSTGHLTVVRRASRQIKRDHLSGSKSTVATQMPMTKT
jgi:hypothetical protein